MVRASSGSRSVISSVEPLISANKAVTVLRSPSIASDLRKGLARIFHANIFTFSSRNFSCRNFFSKIGAEADVIVTSSVRAPTASWDPPLHDDQPVLQDFVNRARSVSPGSDRSSPCPCLPSA